MAKMSTDVDHQLLKITQHDKFYARLLSKESSLANPSFRVYYCDTAGAVPFVWESQPGTPKKTDTTIPLPPLPPPPSHHINPNNNKKQTSKGFISRLIKRSPRTSTPLAPSVTVSPRSSTSRYSSPRSSFSSRAEASVDSADREPSTSSTPSTPSTPWARYPVAIVRNVLMSMVCRAQGSDRDTAP